MRTTDEILNNELSEDMLEYLKANPKFREWIKDAMIIYALEWNKSNEYIKSEILKQQEKNNR